MQELIIQSRQLLDLIITYEINSTEQLEIMMLQMQYYWIFPFHRFIL